MTDRILLHGADGKDTATVVVTEERGPSYAAGRVIGERFWGKLVDANFSDGLVEALHEYRELIDDGVISLHDQARERVLSFGLIAIREPEQERCALLDLQVYADGSAVVVLAC